MVVLVYFQHYLLGELKFDNGKYYYNSNVDNEIEFDENTFSGYFYELFDSSNVEFDRMPDMFAEYLLLANNERYVEIAGLSTEDDDFTKLYKLSKLSFDTSGFYIKAKQ
jgi:hypothetical protein